jgi:hypothetical protein
MPDALAPFVTFLTGLVSSLTTAPYDPRAWLALFLGFVLGYGHGLWRWWVLPLALAVAVVVDLAIRAYAPPWALPWQPASFASSLVSLGILILGYVAGHRSESWLARRRRRRP